MKECVNVSQREAPVHWLNGQTGGAGVQVELKAG